MKKLSESGNVFLYATKKGVYKLQIHNDTNCESPREWDNVGSLVLFGRSSHLSDTNQRDTWDNADDFEEMHAWQKDELIILPVYKYEHSGVAFNTTGYACNWDSGQVGFIYCSKEVAVNEFGKVRCTKKVAQKALDCMKGEIETFSNWANGQCYGYILELADWNAVFDTTEGVPNLETCLDMVKNWELNDEWENVEFQEHDSCWGYIEDIANYEDMYVFKEAVSLIE